MSIMPKLLSKFAVRSLLIVSTLLAMGLGTWFFFVFPILRQHWIASHLESHGAEVEWQVGGAEWVEQYLGSYWCTEVVYVEMNHTEEAAELLSWLGGLRSLERLEIRDNGLTDDDLRHLAGLTQLKTLQLQDNAITDKGLNHLKDLYNLEKLVHNKPLGREGIDILSQMPSLEMDYLMVEQVTAQDLLKFSKLPRIRELDIKRPIGDEWAKALSVCEELRYLSITDAALTDQQLLTIVQSNPLSHLYLVDVPVGNSVLPALAEKNELQRLILSRTDVSYEEMLALMGPLATTIVLHGDNIALVVSGERSRHLSWEGEPDVEQLSVLRDCQNCTGVGIEGEIYHGCDLSFLSRMRKLTVMKLDLPLTDSDLKAVSEIPELSAVEIAGPQKFTPAGIVYLQDVPNLTYLTLHRVGFEEAHYQAIGKLKTLREMSLFGGEMESQWMASLVGLQSLEKLSLFDDRSLDDQALRHIGKLRSLSELYISDVPFTDAGLPYLYGMPNLKSVSLSGTECTEEGEAKLQKLLPSFRYVAWEYF